MALSVSIFLKDLIKQKKKWSAVSLILSIFLKTSTLEFLDLILQLCHWLASGLYSTSSHTNPLSGCPVPHAASNASCFTARKAWTPNGKYSDTHLQDPAPHPVPSLIAPFQLSLPTTHPHSLKI